MRVVSPAFEILTPIDGIEILKTIETVGRTCYKSEDITSAGKDRKAKDEGRNWKRQRDDAVICA